jgi:hypothetical protein
MWHGKNVWCWPEAGTHSCPCLLGPQLPSSLLLMGFLCLHRTTWPLAGEAVTHSSSVSYREGWKPSWLLCWGKRRSLATWDIHLTYPLARSVLPVCQV